MRAPGTIPPEMIRAARWSPGWYYPCGRERYWTTAVPAMGPRSVVTVCRDHHRPYLVRPA